MPDLYDALDPTKKKPPTDPNAPTGGDLYNPGGGAPAPTEAGGMMPFGAADYKAPQPQTPMTVPSGPAFSPQPQVPMTVPGAVPFDAPPGSPGAVPRPDVAGAGPLPVDVPTGQPGAVPRPDAPNGLPPGATDMGNNLVRLANGQMVPRDHPIFLDAMKAAGMGPTGAPTAPTPPAPAPTPAVPSAPTEPPATPATPAAPAAPQPDLKDEFRKKLLEQLGAPDASLSDPALKAQADAYGVQQQRAKERAREALAGRAGATGQVSDLASSGAFDQGLVGLEQAQGEAQGGFNANLLGGEIDKQRQQLMTTLALAGNTLSADDQRAMQERLASLDDQFRKQQLAQQGGQFDRTFGEQGRQFDIDAELRRRGIDTQADLGRGELNLRGELGRGGLNLDLLRTLMQGDQFGQSLGADLGKFNATNSRLNLEQLLQGLG